MTNTAQVVDEVMKAEYARCQAVTDQDWGALERLLGDELTYFHPSGRCETKAENLEDNKRVSRSTTRPALDVRLFDKAAVVTGPLVVTFDGGGLEEKVIHVVATQVWVKRNGAWQMVAHHASRSPATA